MNFGFHAFSYTVVDEKMENKLKFYSILCICILNKNELKKANPLIY